MKNILLILFVISGCSKSIHTDNGSQYFIESSNYPLVITHVTFDKCNADYLHRVKNYSFAIHLPDSFPVGSELIFKIK